MNTAVEVPHFGLGMRREFCTMEQASTNWHNRIRGRQSGGTRDCRRQDHTVGTPSRALPVAQGKCCVLKLAEVQDLDLRLRKVRHTEITTFDSIRELLSRPVSRAASTAACQPPHGCQPPCQPPPPNHRYKESASHRTASSTLQSPTVVGSRRIDQNQRVCARFSHTWTRGMFPSARFALIDEMLSCL
jgi:hypothetical protein